jgi:K+-transporting ATPase ATPase A chain
VSPNSWLQLALYLVLLLGLSWPLGIYMHRVYTMGRAGGWMRPLGAIERAIYRIARVDAESETGWKSYAKAMLIFNVLGLVVVYALQRLQHLLPLNPMHMPAVSVDSSFNTATSFATNTNWQGYAGESTMSYLTQMLGLTVQNFVSAATGMAIAVAVIRGFARRETDKIGNFWRDLTRSTVYVLLPLSLILAAVLVAEGTVQTFDAYPHAQLVEPFKTADGTLVGAQVLAVGPAASQIAIKQLGTNGGGFFNVNSSHPFENPTPLTNLLEMLAILLIGAGFCFVFGRMVGDGRQGRAILATMTLLFVGFCLVAITQEQAGNPRLEGLGASPEATVLQSGGNMEGKETRFGIANSAIWATATTAASNGSVNSMHDSYTPLGGLVPMVLMQLGEIVFGGVGSGLYGILAFAVVAVFVAGLMVGRTPEYVGKKIQSYEMKMVSLMILVSPLVVLLGTAVASVVAAGKAGPLNPGPHGFSEILYAFSSAGNNNGSAFAGISANVPFYNVALGLAMFFGRFFIAVPALALAGSLAAKKIVPAGPGTLPTHGVLFVLLLASVILVVGALTFVPALALGPVVEHLTLHSEVMVR